MPGIAISICPSRKPRDVIATEFSMVSRNMIVCPFACEANAGPGAPFQVPITVSSLCERERLWHERRMTLFRSASALLLAFACAAAPSLAASPGASDWQSGFHASFRLVDGGAGDKPGQRLAGVEIRLDPHFK